MGERETVLAGLIKLAGPPREGLVPQSGDPEHPVRWVRPKESKVETHNWINDNEELLFNADDKLTGEAGRAITSFVGHEPGTVGPEDAGTVGFMMADRLEDAYSSDPSATGKTVREGIERAMTPIREALREQVGDSVSLFRYQLPADGDATKRNVLSWTSDQKFAEHLRGSGIYPVFYLKDKHGDNPEVDAGLGAMPFKSEEAAWKWLDEHDGNDVYGDPIEGVELEEESRGTEPRGEIVEANIPLNDLVWITNRAGQSEFIVQNRGEHSIDLMLKAILAKAITDNPNDGQPTPKKFKRVKVTGSKKPGYIKGTAAAQRAMMKKLALLHKEGTAEFIVALRALSVGVSLASALKLVENHFTDWGKVVIERGLPEVAELYTTGLRAGAAEIGFSFAPDRADANAAKFLANQPAGMVPALKNFVEGERRVVEKVVRDGFKEGPQLMDLDAMVGKIQERVDKGTGRLELIVRTETSKIAGMGRLSAWAEDPDRDMYLYHWIPTLDGRHKDVSKLFGEGGPYTFDKIKQLWENPVATIRNRKTGRTETQDDRFNQRCTIARTLKTREQLVSEGRISKEEQERFWDS